MSRKIMPLVNDSSYTAPPFFSSGHLQTIYPPLFRRIRGVTYERERIETADGDFLDLDWSRVGSRQVAILSHGLEGHTQRAYMRGMVRALNRRGVDALAWNFRGCSGEPNRKIFAYHSGEIGDLTQVLQHVLGKNYDSVFLIGFSLGGNMTLKLLGTLGTQVDPRVRRAVAFSVPCDLTASSRHLERRSNALYMKRFLNYFREKIAAKEHMDSRMLDLADFHKIRTFEQFDNRFTAPWHGFKDAMDYWESSSCKPFLVKIRIPTLLVNARNDPFLAPPCFPIDEARQNPQFFLEIPTSGGHTGFMTFNAQGEYWSETRALEFLLGDAALGKSG